MIVKATREGLEGHCTSIDWPIDDHVSFVALPNTKALHRFIKIANPLNGKTTYAEVLDVGPWNIDDPYVFIATLRPLSEQGIKTDGKNPPSRINGPTNGAGIDLGQRVWNALGMLDNGNVDWEFI